MHAEAETGQVLMLNKLAGDLSDNSRHLLDPDTLDANLIIGFEQMNERVHPFFVLRSQLLKHMRTTGMRIFAVTSVQPGNGKTHIAVNLAAAVSRIHPTILVELDLRRPSIGQRLGLPEWPAGVEDYLAGDKAWADTSLRIHGYNLAVHRVRQARVNAEDLLASSHLTDMIETIRGAEGDPICIIDTPPALVHDDLMLIARAIDGVLMVVEEARTRKRALLDTVNSLSPTPVVGSILNMSISSPRAGGEYGYGSYNPPARSPD